MLGWLAEQRPEIVRAIADAGHEIASHGFWHERVTTQKPHEFREDVRASKRALEDLVGTEVLGYRAPSFSLFPVMSGRSMCSSRKGSNTTRAFFRFVAVDTVIQVHPAPHTSCTDPPGRLRSFRSQRRLSSAIPFQLPAAVTYGNSPWP